MVKTNATNKKTTFSVKIPGAGAVSVLGEFNGWNPEAHQMKKQKNGMWKIELKLDAGEYQFKYLADGGQWHNDPDAPAVGHDFGTNSLASISFPKKTAKASKPKAKSVKASPKSAKKTKKTKK